MRLAVGLAAIGLTLPSILWAPMVGASGSATGAAAAGCPSFQGLVDAARTGSTITVPPCTYHETVTINKMLTVSATGAVIDGDNVRSKGLLITADDVVVDGLTVKRVANGAHVGAVHATSVSRFTFRNGVARDSATVCIVLGGGSGFRILDSEFTGCGQEGYFLNNVTDSLIRGNKIHHNNMQLAFSGSESGGGKTMASARITFDRNEVAYNRGPGIWFDNGVIDVAATNNRVHDNDSEGIFFEISDGARIAGNSVWANGFANPRWAYGAGINVSSSNNAEVDHNTVAWNARGISVISQNRGVQPHRGITVYRNTVIGQAGDKVAGWYDDHGGTLYAPKSKNRGWAGRYWIGLPEPTSYRFEWSGSRSSVSAYNATPGEEGAVNLTAAQRDRALRAAGIPTGTMPSVVPSAPAGVPTIAFRGGSLGSSIPGTISWPAAADTVAYRLQLQVDNGAWRDVPIPTPTATSLATTFLVGHSYRVRLGNKLAAGVWSAWAYSPAIPVGLYEETASQIAYAGSWTRVARSGASGGYVRLATSSTAVATATFRARAFAWIAPLGPTLGSATIYLDGALVGSVDLYRASASTRRIVYVASWPTSRRHVLEIHVSGTTGHPEIDLDAIAVAG
jgi:nitrous oxidase accessory protein NosD